LFIGFRAVELSIIFSPVFFLYPIRNWTFVNSWYNSLFKTSLMLAGPIFIKLGQWMSTRRDLYDDAFISTLSRLTTESKIHSFEESKKQISSLVDLKEFKYIDPHPVGI
jgi:aarF domain-containing kinase